jgi:hypothetical protein
MRHLDADFSTVTEEVWQEVVQQRPSAPETLSCTESRVARFFTSLVASMALHQRRSCASYRDNRIVSPAEMLAQQYPHLYIQAMCG